MSKLPINNKNYAEPTKLSVYISQGVISIREAYYGFANVAYRRQLFWRDLYANIIHAYPYVAKGPFYKKYSKLPWSKSYAEFNKWQMGKTGIKQVDAAMRMLIKTGYMPNRMRLVTANYLVKTLFVDWRWGEAHFAKYLLDFDQASNNGNWQWVASTGADAQPYFRSFNPYNIDKKMKPYIEMYCSKDELERVVDEKEIDLYRKRTAVNIHKYKKLN